MCKVRYPHPGEILFEEFLKPMGITQYRLAKEIGVPQRRIGKLVVGELYDGRYRPSSVRLFWNV
jgi:addiction module HigA family antidote